MTRWLSEDQQQDWRAYIVGSTLLMDTLDRELRQAHGIALAEYEILVRLSEAPGRMLRMAQIAASVRHSRSRVTHTVARMEKAGWIERREASGDGRGVDAVMTEAGWRLLEAAAHTHVTGVREHFVDLASEADFQALGRVMKATADKLVAEQETYADLRDEC